MACDAQGLPATAPLDREAILERLGGNAGLLGELAAILLEECPGWLLQMDDALRRGDAAALQFTAHLLRGSVSALGPCEAYQAAGVLEARARAGDLRAAAEAYAALAAAFARLGPALAALARPARPGAVRPTGNESCAS
jgi:hypothetical protein